MQKSPLVAVNTNFPLLLVDGDNAAMDVFVSPREIVQKFYR
jgi:hypothetical protein